MSAEASAPALHAIMSVKRSLVLILDERIDEAAEILNPAEQACRELSLGGHAGTARRQMGTIAYLRGNLDEARNLIQDSITELEKGGLVWLSQRSLLVLAKLEADSGNIRAAKHALEKAKESENAPSIAPLIEDMVHSHFAMAKILPTQTTKGESKDKAIGDVNKLLEKAEAILNDPSKEIEGGYAEVRMGVLFLKNRLRAL